MRGPFYVHLRLRVILGPLKKVWQIQSTLFVDYSVLGTEDTRMTKTIVMKQILHSILLTMIAVLVPLIAQAHDFEVDGIYYNIDGNNVIVTNDGTYSVDGRYKGDIVIPESVTYSGVTYPVVSIGNYAFNNCTELTSVVIPNSVTLIDEDAFAYCTSLASVTIGNSLTTINGWAFFGCIELTNLNLPNTVKTIGEYAFCNCTSLTNVNIPASLTTLGGWAFFNCALTEAHLPASVSHIGLSAFGGCQGLSSLSVASENNVYDSRDNCNAIIETANNILISGCKNTTIPATVTVIGDDAFSGCTELTAITIPDRVTAIGDYAFGGCSGLTGLEIPASVTSITHNAFSACTGLSSITVVSENPTFDSRDNCTAIIETANNMLITGCKSTTIPTTVTAIGDYAFGGCSGLISIDIPNSVNSINLGAFNGCSGLASIDIPNSVTNMGMAAFAGCTSLSSITLGNSLKTISESLFGSCMSLESIVIPNSVVSIGNHAFVGCESLQGIVIPDSVITIGDYAFWGCSALKNLTIGSSVSAIGKDYGSYYVFWGCPMLTNIMVAADNKTYDSRDNCNAIIETATNKLILGSGNTIVPNTIETIGYYAFSGKTSLTSVNIPTSVNTVENLAFLDCTNLTDVYCYHKDPSVLAIDYGVFAIDDGDWDYYYSRRTLHVPVGAVEAYQNDWFWTSCFANIVEMDEDPGLTGDVNGDGDVNISDVNAVIDAILRGFYSTGADVNCDGDVNISDINAILAIILK